MRQEKKSHNLLKWTSASFGMIVLLGLSFKPEATQNFEKKRYRVPNISILLQPVDHKVDDQIKAQKGPINESDFVMQ